LDCAWTPVCKGFGRVFPNAEGNAQSLPNLHSAGSGRCSSPPASAPIERIRKYGLHSFRHAAASLWIEHRFSPKRVQALMGHQMTFDVCGHLFPSETDDPTAMAMVQAQVVR
jgi:integrase